MSFLFLQIVTALSHLVAGGAVVILSFRGLEEHPLIGAVLGAGLVSVVVYADLFLGNLINPWLVPLDWGQIEALVVTAAVMGAFGFALTAISVRPEMKSAEESEQSSEATSTSNTKFGD